MLVPAKRIALLAAWLLLAGKLSAAELEKQYYPDGRLKEEYHIKDGKRDGLCRTYAQSGTIALEESWKDGKRDGLSRVYNANGTVLAEALWEDGALKSIQNADMGVTGWIPGPAPAPSSIILWLLAAWISMIVLVYVLVLRSEH